MNTAKLTALHTETLTAAHTARTSTNISRRAATPFTTGGCTAELFAGGLYPVFGPEGPHSVACCDSIMGYICDCPTFADYTTCKHLQAVDLMLRDEAQAAEHDALYANRDDDAYARF